MNLQQLLPLLARLRGPRVLPWLLAALLAVAALLYMKYALAATYTVNTTADTAGSTCSGTCSLRQAIGAANAAGVGPHTININIAGCSSGCSITLNSNLTDISRAVVINGTAQSGYSGVPLIRIDGDGGGNECFTLKSASSGSTLRGLVMSGCKGWAVKIEGDNNLVAGNYIGTNLSGNTASANDVGIWVRPGTVGNTIGGSTAADRNVISGNSSHGIFIETDSTVVTGNYIGVGANGSTALGNAESGVRIDGGRDNNRIGGVNAGEGNIIANNGYDGITLGSGNSSGNAFLRNQSYNNTYYSIDLSDDGVTNNDGGDGDSGANYRQNFPVLTSAVTTGDKITIGGTLNSNASTAYRIEFYSTPTADGSGHGEGQVYLGSTNVTTNGSGNASFSQQITGIAVTAGHAISATATVDLGGGNYGSTSEFALNYTATLAPAGVTSSAISGNTTEAGGSATFTVVLDRIPSANVTIPISSGNSIEGTASPASLTFTTANWNTPQTVTVTGQNDTLVDGNRAYSIVLGAATSGDGGYNGYNPADVAVTNTDNDTQSTIEVTTTSDVVDGTTTSLYALLTNQGADGKISLREAITAANNSANGGSGADRIHFAIALGAAGFTGTNGVDGRWVITLASALPQITDAAIIDGTTQTTAVANSNPGVLGAGGTVGTDGLALGTVNRPEIEIVGSTAIATAFNIGTSNVTIRGFAIRGVGSGGTDAAIVVGNNHTGTLIEQNILGSGAVAFTDPGAGLRNYVNIYINGADSGTVQNNLMGFTFLSCIQFDNTSTNWLIDNNEIRDSALQAVSSDGIGITGGSAITLQRNLITGTASQSIVASTSANNLTIVNNTVTNSGIGIAGSAPTQTNAIAFRSSVSNVLMDRNILTGNYGAGLAVNSGATGVRLTQNSVYNNGTILSRNGTAATGQIGVDLNAAGDNTDLGNAPFYTTNDAGDADSGGNNLQNFPVLAVARTDAGSQIILTGSLNSNANSYFRIEFFASSSPHSSGYGVGERYLGSLNVATDGSGNATISTTLSTNVAVGEHISATATKSVLGYGSFTDTSEYSRSVVAVSSTQATITVDTASDVLDGDTTSLSTLLANKGADGFVSLREAITAANNSANGSSGPDRIHFNISGSGPHTITPATALPAITQPVVIDGSTEPDFATNGNRPIVVLDGNNLAADGLVLASGSGGSTIRGLVVRDFGGDGIEIQVGSNGNTVAGNYIGRLTETGVAAAAGEENAGQGVYVLSANNTLGGTTASDRNVVSGNSQYGINLDGTGATGNTVAGNHIGVTALGNAMLGNAVDGVGLLNGASSNTVGGSTTAHRNVISANVDGVQVRGGGGASSNNVIRGNYIGTDATGTLDFGNTDDGIDIDTDAQNTQVIDNLIAGNTADGVDVGDSGSSSGTVIQGNLIGTAADGSSALGNGAHGVLVGNGGTANSTTIGGTAGGQANTIAFNGGDGVYVVTSTSVAILSNSIHSNTGLGIDLGTNGVTANDANDGDTGANNLQNFPVLSSAALNAAGTQITITGSLNSVASSSFRIEFYASTSADASGYGEGQRLIGSANVTTDGAGNATINSVLAVVVASGESVSATATLSNVGFTVFTNTSEFAANVVAAVPSYPISGTVFEDIHYGGGAGRTLAASAGSGVNAARLELYNSAGTYVTSTNSAADGSYTFTGLVAGTYYVRVASQTVASTRSGSSGALRGVLTWRADASSGSAVAVTDHVGGTNPALADPGSGAGGTTFNTGTNVFTAGLSGTAHAVTPVVVSTAAITGLDFGFNFSSVVNVNDSGPGSLRQAITNANALADDAALLQVGLVAARENLVFMISNGTAAAGLRAANNLFASGVATIAPLSALPAVSAPLVIDAQKQPGWASVPIVELNGAGAGAGASGLSISAGSSTVRGLVINRFAATAGVAGISLSGSGGNTVQGNYIGTNSAGTAAQANYQGLLITTANNSIGGSTAAQRNVISGNTWRGVMVDNSGGTANSNQIQGNYVGTNAAGTAALANSIGVYLSQSPNNTIGGVVAGQGNVISGNTNFGIYLVFAGATGNTVQGNTIGLNAAGLAAVPNGASGIEVCCGGNGATGNTIGGTAAGAGNVIAGNTGHGIRVFNGAANAIQRNSIYDNGALGIELGNDGVTANNGGKNATLPNSEMDFPVFTTASLSGTTLTVAGYVGSAAGQNTFANASVEVFIADTTTAGNGEGKTYLGTLTADANGNFSGSITGVTGATIGSTQITGTATDGSGNTSEFGANLTIGWGITGTVFEDVNYGGGAGRSQATAAGVGLAGATVELYDAAGVWVRSTTTASGGSYSFMGLTAATYQVRVVGGTVLSQRSGSSGALLGVMTYRTTAASGAAVAVTDQVGGTTPSQVDPGAGSSGATFNTSTGVFSAVLTGTAQSFAPVVVTTAIVGGVDFGFNFNTVVNTNDTGPGSLRQALTNANTFNDDNTLAVAGRTAAVEHVIFMLADGTTRPGLRNTFASQFAAGVAALTPTSALPAISSTLVLDAQMQPGWVQDPIVELRGNAAGGGAGLTLAGGAVTVRGLVINRYGSHGISITGGAAHTVQGCWVGTDATGAAAAANGGAGISVSTTAVGLQIGGTTAAQRNVVGGNSSHGMNIYGGSSIVVQGNYVGTSAAGSAAVANGGRGVFVDTAVTTATVGGTAAGAGNVISGNADVALWLAGGATTVQGNLIGLNAAGTAALANSHGVHVASSGHLIGGTSSAARNVIAGNTNRGIWLAAGGNTVQGNYVGTNAAGTLARPNTDGIYAAGINNVIGGTAAGAGNLVSGNSAAGVLLAAAADGSTVQGNTIGRNASLGAALANNIGVSVACSSGCAVGGTAAGAGNVISGNTTTGVTVGAASQGNAILGNAVYGNGGIGIDLNANGLSVNDGAKTGGAGNQLMDHPVFTSARARGDQLTVAGYVGSAAGQSLFANARVEIFTSDQDTSGHGEGPVYLGSVTTDASGNFSATFTMTQAWLAVGTQLTATATDSSNNTSEFGANFTGLIVDLVVNHNGDAVDASPGDGVCQTATPGQCTLRAALQEVNALAVQPSALTVAFALPGCSAAGQAACIITPPTALPALAKAAIIDGQTQSGWTLAPLVELVGSSAPAGTVGLQVNAASSVVRGLVLGGFNQAGVAIAANGVLVQGNVVGLQGDGSTARGNGTGAGSDGGVLVSSGTGVVIGGNSAAQRNVLSGNGGAGLWVDGGTVTVQGNYIGTNAAGTAAAGNGRWGVHLSGGSGHVVGGAAAGTGNVVSGHVANGTGGIYVQVSSVTVQGNYIGTNAAGNAFLPNGDGASSFASGIDLRAGSGHWVGGTAAGEGNVIAGNQGHGVRVATQTSRILGNSIHSNLWLGIDRNADNVSANDGAFNGAQPNNGIDHAVVTGAGVAGDGNSITVLGYIGTGTGQAAFAGARVEFFKAAADPSGYGEGQTYLGTLTADANGRFYGTLAITFGSAVIGDTITATATDAAGNSSEFGPNFTSTNMAGLAPAGFNAFETDTGAGALTGVIRSKVASTAATLAFLALDSAGTAPHAGFTGSVQLNWLDARDDSGAISGSCRASWLDLGAAGTATFSNNNRVDVAVTPPATATKAMRLQMTYVGPGGTVVACSNDAFAALPAQLAWLGASDADSATAGTTRALDNVATTGGVVHQAGRAFTLRAQALTSTGVLMTAYDGTPALAISSCVLPAACTAGALGGGSVAASGGLYTHNTVTYSEVGAVALALSDTSYANVDSGDTALGLRTITSSALSVGRFVPDSFGVTVSTAGVLATTNASCLAAGTGATFLGQGFGWATVPQVTVTARNAAGATTLLWTGSLMKLAPGAGLVPSLAVASAGTATLAASYAASTVQDLGAGQARLQAGALDRFVLDTPASAPQASTTPSWQWQLAVTDSAEAGTAGNPQPGATATQATVLFNQGGLFHSGRLALATAHGDSRSGVRMLMQLQRYTAAGWVLMTEDRGCVTLQRGQLEAGTPSGVFVGAGVCAAPLTASATTAGGRAWLALPATPGGAPGRLVLRVAGTAAAGDACSPAGAVQAVTSLGLPWLTGGTSGAGPQASATWGRPQRDMVLRREIW